MACATVICLPVCTKIVVKRRVNGVILGLCGSVRIISGPCNDLLLNMGIVIGMGEVNSKARYDRNACLLFPCRMEFDGARNT